MSDSYTEQKAKELKLEQDLIKACQKYWHARKTYYESLAHKEGSTRQAKDEMYKIMEQLWGPIDSSTFLVIFERERLKAKKEFEK